MVWVALTLVKLYPEAIAVASAAEESALPSTVIDATKKPVAGVKVKS